jgi:hypothetical protein
MPGLQHHLVPAEGNPPHEVVVCHNILAGKNFKEGRESMVLDHLGAGNGSGVILQLPDIFVFIPILFQHMEKKILGIAAVFLAVEGPEIDLVLIYRKEKEEMEYEPCDAGCYKTDKIPDCIFHFFKLSISLR